MKLFLMMTLLLSSLFAGGDILPVSSENQTNIAQERVPIILAVGAQKPKCEDCGEPAELLPYYGEDIPMAQTFPCPDEEQRECEHYMA